jgi:hypothetical protein
LLVLTLKTPNSQTASKTKIVPAGPLSGAGPHMSAMKAAKSQPVDDFLETGLSFLRHAPKTAKTEQVKAKDEARSISQGE